MDSSGFVKDGWQAGLWKIIPSGATNGTVAANGDVTIGSAVSTVTVTNAFNQDFVHYLVTVSGGASSTNLEIRLRLGATATNYKYQLIYGAYTNTVLGEGTTTATSFQYIGNGTSSGLYAFCHLYNPQRATRTQMQAPYLGKNAADSGNVTGVLDNTTQYTDFTLLTDTGTMTGGTIAVYGYNA